MGLLVSLHQWYASWALTKKHVLFVDMTVTSFASYLALKKTFGWSLSEWLNVFFQPSITSGMILILAWLCGYAAVSKVANMALLAYPGTRVRVSESEKMAQCCLRINNEIRAHTLRIEEAPGSARTTFRANHQFDVNVALVVDALFSHMLATLSGATKNDLFISVYKVPSFHMAQQKPNELEYIVHYPESKDVVASKLIELQDGAFKQYECAKCLASNQLTWHVHDCSNYYRSATDRHKNIRHYIGLKLFSRKGVVVGFLNIEFSNASFFASKKEMVKYIEENVLSFRYLLEYQFLKSVFFYTVEKDLAGVSK